MKQSDAILEIKNLCLNSLTDDDILGLIGCTPNQLAWIIKGYQDQYMALKGRSIWDDIIRTLEKVPEWVSSAENLKLALSIIFLVI
jgi:hypothetical protein